MSNTFLTKKRADPSSLYPVLLIFGPTAVGKTQLINSFFHTGYEIINADSMQVYTGLDIGTAKPSQRELSIVPHHLINVQNPDKQFTVGDFVISADALIADIAARGNIPLISGGTAYYFKHFLFGLPGTPKGDSSIRKRLENSMFEAGVKAMHERLALVDPESAKKISKQDAYRIIRALEVFEASGFPLSSYKVPQTLRSHIDPLIIGLYREKNELERRIEQRVEIMMNQGLADEIKHLISHGAQEDWPGMKGIGYREFFLWRKRGEASLRTIRNLIIKNSCRYAKQQMTFFKSLPEVQWYHPDQTELINQAVRQKFPQLNL
ncbi:MAG: tRNA (adenosine(37)-N6)-dimethylallyltransferase MiaA [Spirochaetia bacterium]|nr:tRNA (adenosine(37)-N6)-dimethylallyltransferase MiaA [Spirochaetia bacterium]